MSGIRSVEGGEEIVEEFLEEQGVTIYMETTDAKGKSS